MNDSTGKVTITINSEELSLLYFQGDDEKPRFERKWQRTSVGASCTSKGTSYDALVKAKCKLSHENKADMIDLADHLDSVESAAISLMCEMDRRENS